MVAPRKMEFGILGPVEAHAAGRLLPVAGLKPRGVLAILLLHANEAVTGERIAAGLWGEDAPAEAGKTVQVHVSRLRKALGDPDVLVTTAAGYHLRVARGSLDSDRFEELALAGREALAAGDPEAAAVALHEALTLWRGPALADVASLPFAAAEIARLEERRLATIEARAEADLACGVAPEDLVAELRRLVADHPWRERLHARLMLTLYRAGRQADALDAFQRARAVLRDELGLEPGVELRELQQAILVQDPALAGPDPPPQMDLPSAPTKLFGRDADLDGVADVLADPEVRLLTLVGPGGVGKTRLALEAARRLGPEFRHGAHFVSLASLTEGDELPGTLQRALGATAGTDDMPMDAVLRFLARRDMLLVLDNFEQLMAAVPALAELIRRAPGVKLIVTSREPTRLRAERLHVVMPLAVPPQSAAARAADVEEYPAAAVFCDRVRARDSAFRVDADVTEAVVEICRRLDGLPLALELAAARIGLLSPAALAGRLDRALDALGSGARDGPDRHLTLRATIDWSHDLLNPDERRLFAHLSVFAAGATVAAAEAVTGASLDELESLVSKHLVVRRVERLMLLETVREYATERLAADPESDEVHRRLGAWMVELFAAGAPCLNMAEHADWLPRLDAELPNALASLAWAIDRGDGKLALELGIAMFEYWLWTSREHEGARWLESALQVASDAPDQLRARAMLCRARLQPSRDFRDAVVWFESSLELFRACADARGISQALSHLALAVGYWLGDLERAQELSDEALAAAERCGDPVALAQALAHATSVSSDFSSAERRAHIAVPALRTMGHLLEASQLCSKTGYAALAEAQDADAIVWLEEGVALAREAVGEHDEQWCMFLVLGNLGIAHVLAGDDAAAATALTGALGICVAASCEDIIDETLLGLAVLAARAGDSRHAAILVGAARRHATRDLIPHEAAVARRLGDLLAAAREEAGPDGWDADARTGAVLTRIDAIALGLRCGGLAVETQQNGQIRA